MIDKKNLSWNVLLFLTFMLMGSMHPAVKVLSGQVSPILLNFLRFFIATIILIPFVLMKKVKIEKKDLKIISLLGVVGITLYGILDIIGVNMSTSINNSILLNSWPIMLVLLAPILIKEKVKKESLFGFIIGFIGVVLVTTNGTGFSQLIRSEFFMGNLFILGSALSVMLYSMYNKKYIKKYGGLNVTFHAVIAGTIVLFILSVLNKDILLIKNITINSWLLISWVAIAATAFTWVMWFIIIDKVGLVKSSSMFFFVPIAGILFSYIFLDEKLTIFTFLGTLLVLSGVYIVQKSKS